MATEKLERIKRALSGADEADKASALVDLAALFSPAQVATVRYFDVYYKFVLEFLDGTLVGPLNGVTISPFFPMPSRPPDNTTPRSVPFVLSNLKWINT